MFGVVELHISRMQVCQESTSWRLSSTVQLLHFQAATVPLEDINSLLRIFAFPIGREFIAGVAYINTETMALSLEYV